MTWDPVERYQPLHVDPDFQIGTSTHMIGGEDRIHLHVEVHRLAPSVLRRLDLVFRDLRPTLPPVIGAIFNSDRPVNAHFAKKWGWIPVGEVPWPETGAMHTLWVLGYFE